MKRYVTSLIFLFAVAVASVAAPAPKCRPRVDPAEAALAAELQRFPSADECRAWITFADEHTKWIDSRILLFRADVYDWLEYRRQVQGCRQMWVMLRESHDSRNRIDYRWECLDELRDAIGEESYWMGFLWPPVAAHMLPRRD